MLSVQTPSARSRTLEHGGRCPELTAEPWERRDLKCYVIRVPRPSSSRWNRHFDTKRVSHEPPAAASACCFRTLAGNLSEPSSAKRRREPVFEFLGIAGITISMVAYVPQVVHLGKEHCSAGISRRAWAMWLVGSLLVGALAVHRGDLVSSRSSSAP